MGIKELKSAFQEVLGPAGTCVLALLDYKPSGGTEYQILTFSGSWTDGTGWVITSNLIRPSGDLVLASRETAQALLQQKGPT